MAWLWKRSAAAVESLRLELRQREQELRQQEQELRQREQALLEASKQRKKSEQRARLTSFLGVAGFVVAVIGIPLLLIQNQMLSQQVNLQKEAIEISGPVLSGTALIVEEVPTLDLFSPGTDGIERYYKSGEIADDDTWVRIEVTNSGQFVGAITSASIRNGQKSLPARTLMCGLSADGPWLEPCKLPVKVDPGGIAVFVFDLPQAPCIDIIQYDDNNKVAPEEVIASFKSIQGESTPIPTGVLGRITQECPMNGE